MSKKPPPDKDDGAEDKNYEVGYCRPPKHSQFAPGQSGNPKGRRKGRKNLKTICMDALAQKVTVRQGNKSRKMPAQEAIAMRLVGNALNGDQRAIDSLLKTAKTLGLFDETTFQQERKTEQMNAAWEKFVRQLSDEDLEVMMRVTGAFLKEVENNPDLKNK